MPFTPQMKQLVIFPKGSLTPKERERISKAGYLAIEADTPRGEERT